MREYETTFIIQPELSDEGIADICKRLESVLEKNGAARLFYDDMGKRRGRRKLAILHRSANATPGVAFVQARRDQPR